MRARFAMQVIAASILPYVAFDKYAFPNRRRASPAGPNRHPAKMSRGFLA
jgi:hypothetical protein